MTTPRPTLAEIFERIRELAGELAQTPKYRLVPEEESRGS